MIVRAMSMSRGERGEYNVRVKVYGAGDVDCQRVEGEVSLEPCRDGRPGYEACGQSPDAWVEGGILNMLDRESLTADGYRSALDEIEAVASAYLTSQ